MNKGSIKGILQALILLKKDSQTKTCAMIITKGQKKQ